jgi:hypothetical protein
MIRRLLQASAVLALAVGWVGAGLEVSAAAAEARGEKVMAKLDRPADAAYDLGGPAREYLQAVTANWLLKMPEANPAVLEMFADRDRQPYRRLLPWSGEFAGKYLTGAVQVWRLTRDPALKDCLGRFVARLVRLQDADGYLGPFPKEFRLANKAPNADGAAWDVWGHYHIMLGLLLWHEETGDAQALDAAVKIGDLLCRKFLDADRRIVDTCVAGSTEMNHAALHGLCLLARRAPSPKYLSLARQIVKEFEATAADGSPAGDYVRTALAGKEFFQCPRPRWESLHAVMGLAELYRLTGEEDYRLAFERLWWSIAKLDRHNNGGFSSGEQAQGNPYHRGAIETCCTVAWIAMSVEMLRLTGDSVVADEIELATLNSVLGYQSRTGQWCTYNTPMDGRRVPSTVDIAFQKRPGSEQVNCCSANAPRGLGMISDWALMADAAGLVLNWYGPSTMTARAGATKVALRQRTDYPRDGRVLLEVGPERPAEFALRLRLPHWSAATAVRVNGAPAADARPGTYLALARRWAPGDRVEIDLDMSIHVWAGRRECEGLASLYRGPILLSARGGPKPGDPRPGLPELDGRRLAGRVVAPEGDRPPILCMEFAGADGRTVRLQDFATAGEGGAEYVSWLKVKNVRPLPFTRANPLRSVRPEAK